MKADKRGIPGKKSLGKEPEIVEHEYIKHMEGMNLTCFLVSINNRIPHLHRDMEILFILDGSVIIRLDDGQHVLHKNDFLVIGRNEIHSLVRTQDNNLILAIQVDVNFCKSYFPEFSRIHFIERHITRSEKPQGWESLRICVERIIRAYSGKKHGYPLEIMSSLNSLCFHLIDLCKTEEMEATTLLIQERQMKRLSRIVDYIHENYKSKLSLKDLAASENLDMYYLSHFIHDSLGISFQQYLTKVRLEKAADLMFKSNSSKIDICLETGFSDYRYLSKAFQKEYGCSPSEYKKHSVNDRMHVNNPENDDQHIVDTIELAYGKIMGYITVIPDQGAETSAPAASAASAPEEPAP